MRLLIIGSSKGPVSLATTIAQDKGAIVRYAATIEEALHFLRSGQGADLVMIDVSFAVSVFIKKLLSEHMVIPIIGFGLNHDADLAVAAIKAGAKEYISLPPDEKMIAALFESMALPVHSFICHAPSMQKIIDIASQVASSEATILLTGESGTGKEEVAQFIHKQSKRSCYPMISLNCAAIPEQLLESELFGHEKGAFTGAIARRIGKFEEADKTTILLDEISEMDLRLQAKLLRTLQEKVIERVGGQSPLKVNFRVIATSNRDLRKEVAEGRFREDLYFRLNVIHLHLPPLRERKEDIAFFAHHFAEKYSILNNIPLRPFAKNIILSLENNPWHGNVRELENTIHRAILLEKGPEITSDAVFFDMPHEERKNKESSENFVGKTVETVEENLIIDTLQHCKGNRVEASMILGISIRTLRNKLNSYSQRSGQTSNG